MKLKSALLLAAGLMFVVQASFAAEMCISGADQKKGTQDSYSYELWSKDAKQTACMTLNGGALFSGRWTTNVENYLGRRGLSYDSTKTPSQIGYFHAVYDATYTPGCQTNGNSYMGVYGWTRSPLVEYYIVENWCNWNPSMDPNAVSLGWRLIGGEPYRVYSVQQTNKPSIDGNKNFIQYFSIKEYPSTHGTVSISDHFAAWAALGLPMGKLHEVSFLVEGYKSGGSYSFSKLEVKKTSSPFVPFNGFDILPTYNTLRVGQTFQLNKAFYPSNATDQRLSYSSYNNSIITVSSTGLVTAKKVGKTNVLAYTFDGTKRDESVFTINP